MALKSQNTMAEAMEKVIKDLASMKTMPDADIGFILHIETQIVEYLRQGFDQASQQSQMGGMGMGSPQQAPPPMDPMGMMPTGVPQPGMDPNIQLPASPLGGRMSMGLPSPTAPAVDEVSRMQRR